MVAAQVARGKPRLVSGVCGGSRARVYIGAQRRNPSNVGHAHVARPSRLQQSMIQRRIVHQRLSQTLGFPVQQKDKLGSIPQTAACTRRDKRGGGARV
jgi:hypothetical protein